MSRRKTAGSGANAFEILKTEQTPEYFRTIRRRKSAAEPIWSWPAEKADFRGSGKSQNAGQKLHGEIGGQGSIPAFHFYIQHKGYVRFFT